MHDAEKEFQKIYEDHYPRIVRYLRRLVGDSDAEDVAQEVFVSASVLVSKGGYKP